MRKITCCIIFLLFACGARRTHNQLVNGNYDEAISIATNNLKNNKEKERKQDFIYMLEEAFAKAKERDLRDINALLKEGNPANSEKIYNTYVQLSQRQEKIRPLLPLRLIKEKRDAIFPFDSYTDELINSKNNLSKYLYDSSIKLLSSGNKLDARKVYDDLLYLNQLNPGYQDTKKMIDLAQQKGTDFVDVYTKNETNIMIPARLEYDLLDFSTYGLNDKWTVYHSSRQKGVEYDYGIIINFREINVSPEQIKERDFDVEREINLGKKKLLDRNGHVVNDSLGHPIMVDNIRSVHAKIKEFRQYKAARVTAKVDYVDFKADQLLQAFPISSEFVFENIYARYKGDKRAVEENYLPNFDNRPLPFPTSEQMVYDCGEDLKAKLKDIIVKNRLRR